MSSILRPIIIILDFLQFYLIKLISFYNIMCLFCFLLYVCEIWAHIDIFKCPNLSFKIVAPAVISILRAGILKFNFVPLYLIKLILKLKVLVYFFLYLCMKYKLIWTYFSAQTWNLCAKNYQFWLLWSQTIP